jgi:hypothetical protein
MHQQLRLQQLYVLLLLHAAASPLACWQSALAVSADKQQIYIYMKHALHRRQGVRRGGCTRSSHYDA